MKKMTYETLRIELIEIQIESGFAASDATISVEDYDPTVEW